MLACQLCGGSEPAIIAAIIGGWSAGWLLVVAAWRRIRSTCVVKEDPGVLRSRAGSHEPLAATQQLGQ